MIFIEINKRIHAERKAKKSQYIDNKENIE